MSGEDDLIARFFAPIAGAGGLGLRDDAALLTPPPGHDLVITTDAIVAGVHFFADDPPASVARKALRVNLSDLAAKGAKPAGFVLTIALPRDWDASKLAPFAKALGEDAREFGCPLLGGDTVSTPGPLTVSITAFGFVQAGAMVPRTGAKPGDLLYVSGTIGDAALGLALRAAPDWAARLSSAARAHLGARYLVPQPRLALVRAVADFASGAMDISDGFAGDLAKMMRVSNASAHVELACVPLSDAAREAISRDENLRARALTGGDDYEILASIPAAKARGFEAAAAAARVRVTRVGIAHSAETPLVFADDAGSPVHFDRGAFSHF